MFKFSVILLIISVCVVLSPADPGNRRKSLLQRFKKGPLFVKREPEVVVEHKVVVVEEQQPCKSDKCRPPKTEYVVEDRPCKSDKCRPPKTEYVIEERPCKSEKCRTCRNECSGNEKCHSECIIIEKCRSGCKGNNKCENDCGWGPPPPPPPPPPHYFENDRCHGCSSSCHHNPPLLTFCDQHSGKWLYYVQLPKTIYLSEFVSNPELMQLYRESNLELDADGMSGRCCLNDKARLELTRLNAVIVPVSHHK